MWTAFEAHKTSDKLSELFLILEREESAWALFRIIKIRLDNCFSIF